MSEEAEKVTNTNPPVATRWKKGQSGNPKGKPKGTKHLSTYIKEMLNDPNFEATLLDSQKGVIEYKGVPIKAIIAVAIQKALNDKDKGVQWADWLAKHGYGSKVDINFGLNDNVVERIIEGTGLRKEIEQIRNEGTDVKQDNGDLPEPSEREA